MTNLDHSTAGENRKEVSKCLYIAAISGVLQFRVRTYGMVFELQSSTHLRKVWTVHNQVIICNGFVIMFDRCNHILKYNTFSWRLIDSRVVIGFNLFLKIMEIGGGGWPNFSKKGGVTKRGVLNFWGGAAISEEILSKLKPFFKIFRCAGHWFK